MRRPPPRGPPAGPADPDLPVSPTSPKRTYAAVALSAIAAVLFGLVLVRMSHGGDAQLLREAAREVAAERVDRPLEGPLTDLSGVEVAPWHAIEGAPTLAARSGEVVLLCFWASYCEPCKREWPSMLQLVERFGADRVRIVAVTYDEDWAAAEGFYRARFGAPPGAPEVLDLRDPATDAAAQLKARYGTEKIPETYVLSGERVLYRFVNERDWRSPAMIRFFERLLDVRG